jgi:hypothetical protein
MATANAAAMSAYSAFRQRVGCCEALLRLTPMQQANGVRVSHSFADGQSRNLNSSPKPMRAYESRRICRSQSQDRLWLHNAGGQPTGKSSRFSQSAPAPCWGTTKSVAWRGRRVTFVQGGSSSPTDMGLARRHDPDAQGPLIAPREASFVPGSPVCGKQLLVGERRNSSRATGQSWQERRPSP